MQAQPQVVLDALLAIPMKVGAGRLRPLTLGALALLHHLKSPLVHEGSPSELETLVAGYVLAAPFAEVVEHLSTGRLGDIALTWAQQHSVSCDALHPLIRETIAAGFAPAAKTRFPNADEPTQLVENPFGNGLGLVLTLLERTCDTYKWPISTVLETPMAQLLVLLTAHNVSSGAEWQQPSYMEAAQVPFDELEQLLESMP